MGETVKMKCTNEDCESHDKDQRQLVGVDSENMDVADASVQWTASETLDYSFNLNDFTLGYLRGGETSEATAERDRPRPYVRSISCVCCGEDFDNDDVSEKIAKITPEQIRATFREMPFPEWKISGRKTK